MVDDELPEDEIIEDGTLDDKLNNGEDEIALKLSIEEEAANALLVTEELPTRRAPITL